MLDIDQTALIEKLDDHQVTRTLRQNGFTHDDLMMTRFKSTHGYPFALWSITYPIRWAQAPEAARYCRLFATLRWIGTDPPWSPDRDSAYVSLALFEIELDLDMSQSFRTAQSRRARRPRGRLNEDGETIASVVATLARQHPVDRPKELWPHLISELDELQLSPVEQTSKGGELQLHYGETGKRRTLTLRRFGTLIGAAPRKCRANRATGKPGANPSLSVS